MSPSGLQIYLRLPVTLTFDPLTVYVLAIRGEIYANLHCNQFIRFRSIAFRIW